MHQKALLTSSVFGLPMFAINVPGSRDLTGASSSQVTGAATNDGLTTGNLNLTNTQFQVPAAPTAGPGGTTYYTGRDGVASNPGEPALPRYVANVDLPGKVLRGIGFRGGAYAETAGVNPFIGAPGTEFGGAQTPFTSTTWYPARMWAASYYAEFSGGATSLSITPAQHRVATVGDATASRRLYSSLDLELFYASDSAADSKLITAPAISDVRATVSGGNVDFAVRVHGTDVAGDDNVRTAWITYTDGPAGCSCWQSVDLTRSSVDASVWEGTLALGGTDPNALRFIVQAANGAALVGINDNDAAYHSLASTAAGAALETQLELGSTPASGTYGGSVAVSATLGQDGNVLAGKTIVFRVGTSIATGVTNASGVASATLSLQAATGPQQISATFDGEPGLASSTDQAPFTVDPAGTSLTLTVGSGGLPGTLSNTTALLKTGATPIAGRTVTFVASGNVDSTAGQGFIKSVTTDAAGVASLGSIPNVPGGSYSLKAYFSGAVPVHFSGSPTITLTDPVYGPSVSSAGTFKVHWPLTGFFSPVDNLPTVNVAKAGSTIPVKFSLGGNRGLLVLAGDPVSVKLASCGGSTDEIETPTMLPGGLTYDTGSGQYQWNWKTTKGTTGCYQLTVKFDSGQSLIANFQLK